MHIFKVFHLEAAHRLPHVPEGHKCARLHGHSFKITVTVRGEVDPKLGWILDFAEIARAWEPLHAQLDHRFLNEVPGLENPTSENLARFVFERIRLPGARVFSVGVAETCTSSCSVYDDER